MSPKTLSLTALALAACWMGSADSAESNSHASSASAGWCGDIRDAAADEALFTTLTSQQWVATPRDRHWGTSEHLVLSPTGASNWKAHSDVRELRPWGDWNFLRAAGDEDRGILCFSDGTFKTFSLDSEVLQVGHTRFSPRALDTPVSGKHRRAALPPVAQGETVKALTAHDWHFSHSLDSYRQPDWVRLRTDGTYTSSYHGGDCMSHGQWSLYGRLTFLPDNNHCRSTNPEVDALPFKETLATVEAQIAEAMSASTCTEADFRPQPGPVVIQPVDTPTPCTSEEREILLPLIRQRTRLINKLRPVRAVIGSDAPIFTDGGLLIGAAFFNSRPRGNRNHIQARRLTQLDVDLSVVWRGELKAGKETRWEVTLSRGEVKSHSPATDTLLAARLTWQPLTPTGGSFQAAGETQVLWEGSLAAYDWTPNQANTLPVDFTPPSGWGSLTLELDYQYSGTEVRTSGKSWMTQVDG